VKPRPRDGHQVRVGGYLGWITLSVLSVLSGLGCDPAAVSDSAGRRPATVATPDPASGPSRDPLRDLRTRWEPNDPQRQAREFWKRVQRRYSTLERYSDQAQIQLTYQLTGNVMWESMPMAVCFNRQSGEWACHAFRTRIFASSSRVVVKIHEAATNHLDGQVKVLPASETLADLWQTDPVARIYLSGATDLPLSDPAQTELPLLAPQLSWLLAAETGARPLPAPTQQAAGHTHSESINLVGWTWHGECPCVRLADTRAGLRWEYWVDIQRELVVRIVFPTSILSPALEHSPEIRGLQICLDMGEIRIDQAALDPPPLPQLPSDRTVRHFVKIPEPFPSPWIGRPSPDFSAPDSLGNDWKLSDHRNRYVVGLLVPPTTAIAPLQTQWESIASARPQGHVSGCIVQDQWPLPGDPGQETGRQPTAATALPSSCSILPSGGEIWATLGLNPGAWLLIWDPQGVLQFVSPLDTNRLSPTIDTVLQRLATGEQVGDEMIREYQRFYEAYLQQLQQSLLLEQPKFPENRAARAN
jgi:hypothetical protein